MSDSHEPNRLIHETSPYLLQHAYNPVDWYPWGPEAFAAARERDLPIFLSVGYSACHWCHVMERESFENPQIAALMNQGFINVKVDREERPDIDQIYMSAVQLVTGQGGWPMSVFLTPEGQPFYGGTYWPPVSRQGMLGFSTVLTRIQEYWRQNREECLTKGAELVAAIDEMHHREQTRCPLNEELLRHAQHRLLQSVDFQEGGFGHAPKFPHPVDLRVLLRTWKRFHDPKALEAVTLTLNKMADGGIYDHLGGGFARYSTDRDWLVPHFEKMLYDNSQLVSLYLEGYQATGNQDYLRIVEETLAYVQREMTSPEGGFYSTQDADSEGVEGKFYVWSAEEIGELLDPAAARLFMEFYQVSESGNWEGQNILHRKTSLAATAQKLDVTPEMLQTSLQSSAKILLESRNQRVWPGRDEKLIVTWNGLMLSAFAQAGRVLGNDHYLQVAIKNADFLLETLLREEGSLWHSRKDGQNRINGFVDDYACLIEGLVDLYLATLIPRYYQAALTLAETLIRKFYDAQTHAWHYTPDDHEELVVRVRDRYDSAIPSGSNLAISCLLKLGVLAGREDFVQLAGECLEAVSGTVRLQPSGMGQALLAIDFLLGPIEEWVLFTESTLVDSSRDEASLPRQLLQTFRPHTLLLFPTEATDVSDGSTDGSTQGSPLLLGKSVIEGKPTLYRCQRGVCQSPITGTETILAELQN